MQKRKKKQEKQERERKYRRLEAGIRGFPVPRDIDHRAAADWHTSRKINRVGLAGLTRVKLWSGAFARRFEGASGVEAVEEDGRAAKGLHEGGFERPAASRD